MVNTAFIFPGQGAQWVGMGAGLYRQSAAARRVFDQANEVLGFDLRKICFEGPEAELRRTANCQPALLTASMAFLEYYRREAGSEAVSPSFVAGHSLGEYTALAASGSLELKDALHLVRQRGLLMEKAALEFPGQMVAVIGMEEEKLREVCLQTGVEIANINSPGQIIISGPAEKISQAVKLASAGGARRAIPLDISGAFHSLLMRPVAEEWARIINNTNFREPAVPLVANVSAGTVRKPEEIKKELITQLCSCVQWERSVRFMADNGVGKFIEFGPGQVLTGLVKRISSQVETLNYGDRPSK